MSSGPGVLTIGRTVRETTFQRSLSLNGRTGWALSRKDVRSSSPPPVLKLFCSGTEMRLEIGFCCCFASAVASSAGGVAGGVASGEGAVVCAISGGTARIEAGERAGQEVSKRASRVRHTPVVMRVPCRRAADPASRPK